LTAKLLTATSSHHLSSARHPDGLPVPNKANLGSIGERLNANRSSPFSANPTPVIRRARARTNAMRLVQL
jgi:hypothetical protein